MKRWEKIIRKLTITTYSETKGFWKIALAFYLLKNYKIVLLLLIILIVYLAIE